MSVINDAQTNRICALSAHSYFYLNTAQYIHVVEYSKCFITDARVCWRSLWGSVVFMYIRASDAPNSLFLQRNYLPLASWTVNNYKKESSLFTRYMKSDLWCRGLRGTVFLGFIPHPPAPAIYSLFVHISDERHQNLLEIGQHGIKCLRERKKVIQTM